MLTLVPMVPQNCATIDGSVTSASPTIVFSGNRCRAFSRPGFHGHEEQYGLQLLSDGSKVASGRSYTVDNLNELGDNAEKIGMELRDQSVLGSRPSPRDGK